MAKTLTTKDEISIKINDAISLALEKNFPEYVHELKEDHHEIPLQEASSTPQRGTHSHICYIRKVEKELDQ